MNTITKNKNLITFFIIIMAAITQAGLVLYTPAFLQIAQQLHVTSTLIKSTLTGYLLGFGLSQLLYGPLSDRIGRKKPLLLGMLILSLGCLWSIFSTSYTEFLLSRIIQGIGAGSCITLSRAILQDSFKGMEYIKKSSYLSSGFALGLGLSPVIGGHILNFFSWHGEFVFLFICSIILFILFWLYLPETHQPREKSPLIQFWKSTFLHFFSTIKNKQFNSYLVGGVMAYGVVIAYTTMTPFLFQKTLGYSPAFYGWLTFIIAIFYYVGTSVNRKLIHRFDPHAVMKLGLLLIILSGLSILLFNVAFGLFNLYVVFIPLAIAALGQALIWSNCTAGALKDLAHIAGTAAAFFSCLQMLLAAAVSGLIAIPHENNQIPLGIVIILLGAISWVVFQMSVFKK